MRLLATIFGVLGLVVFSAAVFRVWGLNQTYVSFDHPLLNQPAPVIFLITDNLEGAKAAIGENPDLALVLPVRTTSDGALIVLKEQGWQKIQQSEKFQQLTEQNPHRRTKIQYLSQKELLDVSPGIHNLQGFLQSFPQQNFVLLLNDNVEGVHQKVTAAIQQDLPKGSFAVASGIESVIKSIKEIRPLTAFSLSQGEQVRLLSFDSIGLISGLQIVGDFIFSDLEWKGRPLVTESLSKEMHRRQKKVFLGPIKNGDDLKRAQALNADGYVFPDAELLRNLKTFIRF